MSQIKAIIGNSFTFWQYLQIQVPLYLSFLLKARCQREIALVKNNGEAFIRDYCNRGEREAKTQSKLKLAEKKVRESF